MGNNLAVLAVAALIGNGLTEVFGLGLSKDDRVALRLGLTAVSLLLFALIDKVR